MLIRSVVDDEVHHQLHAELMHLGEQSVEFGEGAEQRIDVAIVTDVISVVGLR